MIKTLFNAAVVVAALGYFVDIYDLLLFNIVRVESLRDLGFGGRELEFGASLHNIQMTGLMLGGIVWGMIADKRGRLSVLFGSIFLYSLANFLNGYVQTYTEYAFLRFFAGFGLAGELGAGITLVAEILPVATRGYGTMIVATVGVAGAILGGWVGQNFHWRTAYQIGGVLGFALLLLRIGVSESGVYKEVASASGVVRGSFLKIFATKERAMRYLLCVLIGIPIWFTIGILVAYSPEFAKHFGVLEPVTTAKAISFCYMGFVVGDFGSGMLSQWIKSRKHAIQLFIVLNGLTALGYLFFLRSVNAKAVYGLCLLLGTTGGYWAVVVTLAAESFGTNLRATVATTVPNFIRFAVVPMSISFLWLKNQIGVIEAATVVGVGASLIAFVSVIKLQESYGKDLNYLEH